MAVATAVAMTAASCLLSGVIGRIEGSSAFSSGIAVFPLPPRSMLRGVGGSDMLQRKDAGKAGRRGALDHRGRRRAVYCAIICTPCRRNTHSRGNRGPPRREAAFAIPWLESKFRRLITSAPFSCLLLHAAPTLPRPRPRARILANPARNPGRPTKAPTLPPGLKGGS